MSDPISVAGTAVGIISLGLQVCGEIVSFCQAWQGFNEDIETISQKANGLCMPLRALRQLIEDFRTTDPSIATDLEEKAKSIEQAIKRLKTATDRYSSTTSDKDSFRFQIKKAAYPFRKEWLRNIASDLDSIQGVLDTALLIYSTQSTRDLLAEMQQMRLALQDLPKQFMPPPSLLKSWCAQYEQLSALSSSLQIATQGDHTLQNTSIATYPGSASPDSYRTETTDGTSITYHNRSPTKNRRIPRSRPPRKETRVILSYQYYSRMLNFAIRASFSLSKGAGGYSIAPLLHLQPLVDRRDSVGYRIIIEFGPIYHSKPNEVELKSNRVRQELQCAFDLQKASPFDLIWVRDREMSLFDVYCNRMALCRPSESHSRVLRFLLDCGVKPGPIDITWNEIVSFGQDSIGSRLLDLDCSFIISSPHSLARRQYIRHLLFHSDELIQIPNVIRILLQESEDELRDALGSGMAFPNDVIHNSPFGLIRTSTLLDYAFGWPKGIQILLKAGAKPSAQSCRIPFVDDNNDEDTYHSVKLLIEAGFSFHWHDIVTCEVQFSEKIKSLLINDLVARQQRLWHLAQSCLPADQLPNLISIDEKTGKITILDTHTAEIQARLVEKGVSIDTIRQCGSFVHWIDFGSVHHYPYFSAKTLEELYQVGFRDVNQKDSQGLTPLMAPISPLWLESTWVERMHWLVSKGADLYQEVPGTSSTVTHHLGLSFGKNILVLSNFNRHRKYDLELFPMFEKSFSLLPSVRDRCSCACSPGGCTMMSVLLRYIVEDFDSIRDRRVERSLLFREMIQILLGWTRGDTEIGWEVIRFLSFDALGLKHSCCINISGGLWGMFKLVSREEEEVEEIREEEKLRILELEKLLAELKIKFDDLGQPVMEFLEGYWHTRMIEVLSQRDPYDEEHVIESRRIGVTLELDECVVPDRVSLLIGSKIKSEIE